MTGSKGIKTDTGKKPAFGISWSIICAIIALICIIGAVETVFMWGYNRYTDGILYNERLGQMQEVTEQLFNGLEDVVDSQWYNADVQTNRICIEHPETAEQLLEFLEKQAELSKFTELNTDLVVVDDRGRFYTQNGVMGFLNEMEYLTEEPERISFVSSTTTKEYTRMFFLERLKEPLTIQDENRTVKLIYCGVARDMTELNQYFNCKAYEGRNAVYVLDDQGTKLFSGENGSDFLNGFNVYTVLQGMDYLHGSTFDGTLVALHAKGMAYSNAVLNGEECYYALYQMENAAWILLFMVPSDAVAVNTVSLVHSTTRLVTGFAFLMIVICTVSIYLILHRQQQQVIEVEHRNSEMLEKMNADLEEAVETAERAEQAAKEANKAKSEFLANMSHDIRTPMNAIVGITKLMEHEQNDPEKLEIYIHKVQNSSKHLLSLINDVLDMSKIESNQVALNREPVSLAEQVGQVDSIIRPQVEEREQNLNVRVHEIVHEYLLGDAVRLRQIMINLLSNAVKYTPNGGSISFDLAELPSSDEKHAVIGITVTDTGYGMTPEFVSHIFEPFTRAENSVTNRVQGTGLGMAITKNIVDLMGGTISVQSEPDKGSCFHVTLPLLIDPNAEPAVSAGSVLLIASEEALIANVGASFRESNIQFAVATTKEETEQLLQERKVDTVLLSGHLKDSHLPEIVQLLHRDAKDAVLVFCVDYAKQESVADIMEHSGADGLISRPFFFSNFARVVNQVRNDVEAKEIKEGAMLKGMRFLCAEDNALNAEILEALLDMNGASCVIYPDGQQLVEAFTDVKPGDYDAILMDVQMPKMNGLDATRAVRHSDNPLGREIPIIAMTANAFSSDVQECLNAGMDAHVPKPLDIATLERTLHELWSRIVSGGADVCPPVTDNEYSVG